MYVFLMNLLYPAFNTCTALSLPHRTDPLGSCGILRLIHSTPSPSLRLRICSPGTLSCLSCFWLGLGTGFLSFGCKRNSLGMLHTRCLMSNCIGSLHTFRRYKWNTRHTFVCLVELPMPMCIKLTAWFFSFVLMYNC